MEASNVSRKRTEHVPSVLQQHAEEASFLWLLRSAAVAEPHYSLQDLSVLDTRVEAHIDALRIAGGAGIATCLEALANEEAGEAFAAALLAFERGDAEAVEQVVRVIERSPAAFAGAASALGWLQLPDALAWISRMTEARSPTYRRLGIAAYSIHREDPGPALVRLVEDGEVFVRVRALRAVGELKRRDLLPVLRAALRSEDDAVRFWAAWSATLLGEQAGAEHLRTFVHSGKPFAYRAIQLVPRVLRLDDAIGWVKQLATNAATRRVAVIGSGVVGDPSFIPGLIGLMSVPEYARVAGAAFSMITGVDLAFEDLEGDRPAGFEAGPTEDPDDENVEMDPDENLPWPAQGLVRRWWETNSERFRPGRRYLCGRALDAENCRRVLREGRQRQRIAAAYELALMNAAEPLFEWRAPAFRQEQWLGRAGA